MKTHKNSRTATTREGHLSKSELERAVPTTNAPTKYEVTLVFKTWSRAKVFLEATSLEDAQRKGNALIHDWNPVTGGAFVETAIPMKGGF
jgi:hypothetical protein